MTFLYADVWNHPHLDKTKFLRPSLANRIYHIFLCRWSPIQVHQIDTILAVASNCRALYPYIRFLHWNFQPIWAFIFNIYTFLNAKFQVHIENYCLSVTPWTISAIFVRSSVYNSKQILSEIGCFFYFYNPYKNFTLRQFFLYFSKI